MPADILTLGGISFTDFAAPEKMMGGGDQAMVAHKLPGGQRVVDTLGPDDADIEWSGFWFSDDALDNALAVDGMRAAGGQVALTWGGQFRQVIIKHFVYHVVRFPVHVEYEVTCFVVENPGLGVLGAVASTIDSLVGSDLTAALGIL